MRSPGKLNARALRSLASRDDGLPCRWCRRTTEDSRNSSCEVGRFQFELCNHISTQRFRRFSVPPPTVQFPCCLRVRRFKGDEKENGKDVEEAFEGEGRKEKALSWDFLSRGRSGERKGVRLQLIGRERASAAHLASPVELQQERTSENSESRVSALYADEGAPQQPRFIRSRATSS